MLTEFLTTIDAIRPHFQEKLVKNWTDRMRHVAHTYAGEHMPDIIFKKQKKKMP